jgi:hypothetical protein
LRWFKLCSHTPPIKLFEEVLVLPQFVVNDSCDDRQLVDDSRVLRSEESGNLREEWRQREREREREKERERERERKRARDEDANKRKRTTNYETQTSGIANVLRSSRSFVTAFSNTS